jgi:hypothetical protein
MPPPRKRDGVAHIDLAVTPENPKEHHCEAKIPSNHGVLMKTMRTQSLPAPASFTSLA